MITLSSVIAPRRLARTVGSLVAVLAVAACLAPCPAAAAETGPSLRKSPSSSQNPGTCRPKWPYVVLTCVA